MSRVLRSFREMLAMISRGDFSRHCDSLLTEAVETLDTCPADKCKAEIIIKVTLNYELGRIELSAEAKSKLPDTIKFQKTPFWVVDGQLSVEHPSQIDMFRAPRTVASRDHEDDDVDEVRDAAS